MSIDIENVAEKLQHGVKTAFMVSGLTAVAIGTAILVWPSKTAMIVAALLGIYSIIVGLFYVALGLSSPNRTGWARVGNLLLGALYVIAGVVLFGNLSASVTVLSVVIGILIGAVWLVDGIMAISHASQSSSKGVAIFYGVLSVIAGLALLFAPALYMSLLWWILGVMMIVLGLLQVVRGFAIGRLAIIA